MKNIEITHQVGSSAHLKKGAFWLILTVAVYCFLALASYSQLDPGWSYVGESEYVHNLGGAAGAWFASVFFSLFGIFAFLFPMMLVWSGWLILKKRTANEDTNTPPLTLRLIGYVLIIISSCGLGALHLSDFGLMLAEGAGGILGSVLESMLVDALSPTGATLLLIAILVAGIQFSGISWAKVTEAIGGAVLSLFKHDHDNQRQTRLPSARGGRSDT